jgi:hypothetical protein
MDLYIRDYKVTLRNMKFSIDGVIILKKYYLMINFKVFDVVTP